MRLIRLAVVMMGFVGVASAQFMCPNTYKYIQEGQTLEQVRAACGAPTAEQKKRGLDQDEQTVEQWVYNVDFARLGEGPRQLLTFTIQDDKVTNITMEGQGWSASDRCGHDVKIGDTSASVRSGCGSPTFVNKGTQTVQGGFVEYVTWTYDFGQYQPKLRLEFKKGILTSINQGG